MSTAEIAIGALAAALGTAGAVTALGAASPTGPVAAPPPPPVLAPTGPAPPVIKAPTGPPPGPTGTILSAFAAPTGPTGTVFNFSGPTGPAINRLEQVNAQQTALGLASKNPFPPGNPFEAPPALAPTLLTPGPTGPASVPVRPSTGLFSLPIRSLGATGRALGPVRGPFAPRPRPGGRVSTLRRKPKTRSKNGRRSPHKSTVRRHR
jgi:hypothetical protein